MAKLATYREIKGLFIEDAMERLECSKGFARGVWEAEEELFFDRFLDQFWDSYNQVVYDILSQYTHDDDDEDYEEDEEE